MDESAPAVRPGGIVGVLAVGGIVAAFMQTLVVPLIAELPRLLHTTASNATWVVTSTLLASAVAMPMIGRLGDLYGKRRMLLVCMVPLITGSVICALAGSLVPMVVGRGLQGVGMGMIPLGISALRDLLPPERLGSSIALLSSSMGIGGAFGLPLAAVIADNMSWRVLFWGSAAMSALVATLIYLLVRPRPSRPGAASTPWERSASASASCACCSASPRAPTGAGRAARPSGCSPPRSSCCWRGAGGSCGPASRWSTCASPRAPRCCSPTRPRS
ncbi:MFS transporter [Actinomadura luteofluorescens]|uniref:MFS transporter n=1 Tax=Actinomadura luteofluorescens TaxID=46163 RepID=UPI00364426CC